MAYDTFTDGGFAFLLYPKQKCEMSSPPYTGDFPVLILDPKDYKCYEWNHAEREVLCPNPDCPDIPDLDITEEFEKPLLSEEPTLQDY